MRFVHSSDIHLAKRFGGFDEDVRGVLMEARERALDGLAAAARSAGAEVVLLAGDTFDAATPAPRVVRQALQAMAAADDLSWIVLPGNHDALRATALWEDMARACPENVHLALEPTPIRLAGGVILPAPVTESAPGRDLTQWMDDAESADEIRVGLAHGPVSSFSSTPDPGAIDPDRVRSASLDYLALGDWHGQSRVGPRVCYSGTPERDGFRQASSGTALVVDIPAPGADPTISTVPVGRYAWIAPTIDAQTGASAGAQLRRSLPEAGHRRDCLVRLKLEGRVSLSERAALLEEIAAIAPDFRVFETDLSKLAIARMSGDLDEIAPRGALRDAADRLAAQAESEADAGRAACARDALALLFDMSMEAGS